MNKRLQTGFTIYELLITIVIVSIIASVGLPNLVDFTKNSRVTSVANDLHSSFVLARSEAARAKANVTICPSKNSMEAEPDCDGKDDWHKGWIVFVDADGDIDVDDPADEPILRRHPAMPEGFDLEADDGEFFSYGPNGLGRTDVDASKVLKTMIICDERGNQKGAGGWSTARYMVVTPLGRPAVLRDVNQIAAAGGCP